MTTQTITYKVTQVKVDSIQVEYSDGSWAEIPVSVEDTEQTLTDRISAFNPTPLETFESVEQVPVSVGYTGTVTRPKTTAPSEKSEVMFTYKDLRNQNYPSYHQFIEASYAAKNGDTTALTAFYQDVAEVQAEFPSTMPPISAAQYEQQLSANV